MIRGLEPLPESAWTMILRCKYGDKIVRQLIDQVDYIGFNFVYGDPAAFAAGWTLTGGDDFVYDYNSGLVFCEIMYHYQLMSALFDANVDKGLVDGRFQDYSDRGRFDRADAYIMSGLGCFKSKAGGGIYKGEGTPTPSAFRILDWNFREI